MREFDIRTEAQAMQAGIRGNGLIIAIFVLAIPLAIGVAAGRIGMSYGVYDGASLTLFVVVSIISAPFGYLAYRFLSDLGPGVVRVERDRLEFRFEDGKVEAWRFSNLTKVLLLVVFGPNGSTLDFSEGFDPRLTPVPFIQRGLGRRYALSNLAVKAVRSQLLEEGWTERVMPSEGPTYRGQRVTLSRGR